MIRSTATVIDGRLPKEASSIPNFDRAASSHGAGIPPGTTVYIMESMNGRQVEYDIAAITTTGFAIYSSMDIVLAEEIIYDLSGPFT